MRQRMVFRLIALGVLAFLMLAGLAGRAYYLQITEGLEWARDAHGEWSLPVGVRRGAILDRNGLPLTDPAEDLQVAVFPPLVRDRPGAARALASALGIPEPLVLAGLKAMSASGWLALPGEKPLTLTRSQVEAVDQLGLLGITVGLHSVRNGDAALARQLVGYINGGGGQRGLESAFERELQGEKVPDLVAYRTGSPGAASRAVMSSVGKQPYDLVTTIDRPVQEKVEAVLDRPGGMLDQPGGPTKAAVVVMDPFSGEVLAMASRPQVKYEDLKDFLQDEDGPVRNRAITAYPPGSVMKPLVAAWALEHGKARMTDKFECTGSFTIGTHTFFDDESEKPHGTITLKEAIAESCNVTFLKMANGRVGAANLPQVASLFGFGAKINPLGLGHDWGDEQPGFIPPDIPRGALQIVIGGGGMEATPLQIARAYSAIANGGTLPAVSLVKAIKNPAGEVVERPQAGQEAKLGVISAETARQIRDALAAVTDPNGKGTGKAAWLEPWGSAGKTGTAEIGGEDAHAWFAGYFPQNHPRYVAVVLVEHGGYGGDRAARIFRQIAAAILN